VYVLMSKINPVLTGALILGGLIAGCGPSAAGPSPHNISGTRRAGSKAGAKQSDTTTKSSGHHGAHSKGGGTKASDKHKAGSSSHHGQGSRQASRKDRAPAADAAIKGTITVLSNRTDMQANGMLAKYSQEFEKLHPRTTVKWETFVDDSTVQSQMNGGKYPDVMLILPTVTPSELPTFFTPLNSLGLDKKIYFANFQEYQGKVYGIPTYGDVDGVVYSKTAFQKAGITSVPTTLSQFYADCAKLKRAGITPIALNYTAKWPLSNWSSVLPDVIADNPNYLNTLTHTKHPFSPTTPMGKALTVVDTIVKNGWAEPNFKNTNWANSKVEEAKGQVGMMYLGEWAIPQIVAAGTTSSNVGFFPFPGTDKGGKPPAYLTPDWELAVNKHSANIPTAKAFVKWMVLDSGYPNYAGGLPPIKGEKSTVPQIVQFESEAKIGESVPNSAGLTKLIDRSEVDLTEGGAVQYVLNATNFAAALNQLNQQWANAESLGS